MKISDIVRQNEQAEFVNDVQLGWYPASPHNKKLAKSYIFTKADMGEKKSSSTLLLNIRNAFLYDKGSNRQVIIATYGHGKTHLALAFANFFGMPAASEELESILGNIEHAAGADLAAALRDFKENHHPYLVVRLSGDKPISLQQQVITGIEEALHDHPVSQEYRLPHWFDSAARFLDELTPAQGENANAYLAQLKQPLDVATLRQRIRERDNTVYKLCRDLSRNLYGAPLDFGSEVSLQTIVEFVANSWCGEGKPFAGMLILFDELSAFISRYATQQFAGGDAYLQDLLNGVANCPGKVVLVAFAQHDPNAYASNLFKNGADEDCRDSLLKELSHLPSGQRYLLHSSLELVLDAYLSQDEQEWEQLYQQALTLFEDATNATLRYCSKWYNRETGWGTEAVAEILTKGCFPLHPLTAAILCNTDFRQVSGARPVLAKVLEALNERQDEPAMLDGVPNWIYPTALVDWFRDMLADAEWQQYESTCRRIGPDAPEERRQVLKAMLLLNVTHLTYQSRFYPEVVAMLCGRPVEECKLALQQLCSEGFIRKEEHGGYSFWSVGASGDMLEKQLNKWTQAKQVTLTQLARLRDDFLAPINSVWCNWGHPADYAVPQVLFTRNTFTVEALRALAGETVLTAESVIHVGNRAAVAWLIAESDADIAWYRDNAKTLLAKACGGEHPTPLLLAIPAKPLSHFSRRLLNYFEICDRRQEIKGQFGSEVLQDAETRYRDALVQDLQALKESDEFAAPVAYSCAIAPNGAHDVRRVLSDCFSAAYRQAPPAFFTNYKATATALRSAVVMVATLLAEGRLNDKDQGYQKSPVAVELVTKFLRPGRPGSWGLLTADNTVSEPSDLHIKAAWNLLDRAFAPGGKAVSVVEPLLRLFNPPYGYDCNHVTLLFLAWVGYHRAEVQWQVGGAQEKTAMILAKLDKKPKDFLDWLCAQKVRLARRDRDALLQQVRKYLDQIDQGRLTRAEAQSIINALEEFKEKEAHDGGVVIRAVDGIRRVTEGLEKVECYEAQADVVLSNILQCASVTALAGLVKKIPVLPEGSCVAVAEGKKPAALQQCLTTCMGTLVEKDCEENSTLSRLEEYEKKKDALEKMARALRNAGLTQCVGKVDEARKMLEGCREQLHIQMEDAPIIQLLTGMDTHAPLAVLRADLDRLDELKPAHKETQKRVADKRKGIADAILRREKDAAELQARVDKAVSAVAVQQTRDALLRVVDSYRDTQEQQALEAALQRCERLGDLFETIASVSTETMETPEAVQQALNRLQAAKEKAGPDLSEAQQACIQKSVENVKGYSIAKRARALDWLNDCERRAGSLNGSKAGELLRDLNNPPAFLPKEYAGQVEQLREKAKATLDADVVGQIVRLFKRINDKSKRMECRIKLNQIAQEMDGHA